MSITGSVALIFGVPLWAAAHPEVFPLPALGAPWSVQILGLEFMDPTAALGLLATGILDWGVLIAALPAIVLVALLGRFFCGWLCPYIPILAASNAVRALLGRKGSPLPNKHLARHWPFTVLAALLVATALTGTQLIPLLYPPALIGREVFYGLYLGGLTTGAVLLLGAFIFDTFVTKAGFCRFLCPGGATFRLLGSFSPFRVTRTADKCTHCTACDAVCNLNQLPMSDRQSSGCERCGACIAVCPTDALQLTVGSSRLPIVGSWESRK